jgi:hypothetical protein
LTKFIIIDKYVILNFLEEDITLVLLMLNFIYYNNNNNNNNNNTIKVGTYFSVKLGTLIPTGDSAMPTETLPFFLPYPGSIVTEIGLAFAFHGNDNPSNSVLPGLVMFLYSVSKRALQIKRVYKFIQRTCTLF